MEGGARETHLVLLHGVGEFAALPGLPCEQRVVAHCGEALIRGDGDLVADACADERQ